MFCLLNPPAAFKHELSEIQADLEPAPWSSQILFICCISHRIWLRYKADLQVAPDEPKLNQTRLLHVTQYMTEIQNRPRNSQIQFKPCSFAPHHAVCGCNRTGLEVASKLKLVFKPRSFTLIPCRFGSRLAVRPWLPPLHLQPRPAGKEEQHLWPRMQKQLRLRQR